MSAFVRDRLDADGALAIVARALEVFLAVMAIVAVAVLLTGCAAKSAPVTAPALAAAEAMIASSPGEQALRARAEEIRIEREKKAAQKAVEAKDTPEMRKARAEARKDTGRLEAREKSDRRANDLAAVSGCPSGTVKVNSRAVEFSSLVVMASVRITNMTGASVDIETASRGIGKAVENLCAGGAITLAFRRNILTDGASEQITLTAVGRSGGQAFAQTFYLYLNAASIQYQRVDARTWEIR